MNLNKIQQDLIGYIFKLFTKKQLIEYIKTNSDNLFDSIDEIKNSLKPFIDAMSAIKRNKITKKEESMLKKQNREQSKEKKMEKKQSEEEDQLNEEQFKVSRERANKAMDKLRLRGQQRLMRQQREQQEREEYIKQQKARYNREKQIKVLAQQRINQIKQQKQQESEQIQINKKIVPITEKLQKEGRDSPFKIQSRFNHTERQTNGLTLHNLQLELPNNGRASYTQMIDYNYENILEVLIGIQQQKNLSFKVSVFILVEVEDTREVGDREGARYQTQTVITDYAAVNDLNTQLSLVLHSKDQEVQQRLEKMKNSALRVNKMIYASVRAIQYKQQGVGSYFQTQGLLAAKNCCINIQNTDERCAIYCFLYFYYTKVLGNYFKHYERPSNYKFDYDEILGELFVESIDGVEINQTFKIGNVKFPANLTDIEKIAKGFNFTFSLFEYEEDFRNDQQILQVRVVVNQREQEGIPHIDLLMNFNDEDEKLNSHLLYIKNFNRLVQQRDRKETKAFCKNCMNYVYATRQDNKIVRTHKDNLKIHEQYCYEKEKASNDVFPQKGEVMKFKNHQRQQELPFFIVADFEAILTKLKDEKEEIELIEQGQVQYKSGTKKIAKHQVVSYGFYVYDKYNMLQQHYYEYTQQNDENVVMHFIEQVHKISKRIANIIKRTNVPYEMTEELRQRLQNATHCFICEQQLNEDRVIDHNHINGQVRGISHEGCNLHFHLQKSKLPVLFHNLKSYDGNFLLKCIGEYLHENNLNHKIDIIANNSEKFMSFGFDKIRFLDSYQFLSESLEKLADNIPIEKKQITMRHLREQFGNKLTEEELTGMISKGIFPYEFLDSKEKLQYQGLPKIEDFYSSLSDEKMDQKKYDAAVELFQKLGFKTLKQWLQLYNQIDVLLLADIWCNFSEMCLQNYKLDPGFYYSTPNFTFDAMLKMTKAEIELISDPEQYLMIEKQSRGGISTSGSIRYAKSNNRYCPDFDKSKDENFLLYIDSNNLYGGAMVQKLPYSGYKFIKDVENYGEQFILKYDNGKLGYVYEVDLKYPIELHDKHSAYPLAPEQLVITYEMLSEYNKKVLNDLRTKEDVKVVMGKQKKLTPNLMDKVKYVCDIRNLKFYLQQGLILTKIHRIIQYEQRDFLRPYIEFNTAMRQKAKNDFEKDFFKLLNNATYGKTLQAVRKHQNFELVSNKRRFEKVLASRYFKNFIKISDNLALVQKYRKDVKLDKPFQVGMAVLDLSKLTMFDYFYNHLLKQNFKDVQLIMTDTDSLFLSITTQNGQDIYDNMIQNSNLYDFSNVAPVKDDEGNIIKQGELYNKIKNHCEENKLDLSQFLNKNKAVLNKMKNEVPHDHIIEAVSIKAKCYAFTTTADQCKKVLKGIKKYVVKKEIKHQDYIDCIQKQKVLRVEQNAIRSYNHEIYSIRQQKLALQAFNDKKYILENGIDTLSYGHFKIAQFNN